MASKMIPFAMLLVMVYLSRNVADAAIGMNWGRQNAQRLIPSNVVDLLLQNGIQKARIFTSEDDLLQAFVGSGIELTVTISNTKAINTYEKAVSYVQSKLQYFHDSNVRNIDVADYVFITKDRGQINSALEGIEYLQQGLDEIVGVGRIKATIPSHPGMLRVNLTSLRPSDCEFRDEIKEDMVRLLHLLEKSDAPFSVCMHPSAVVDQYGFHHDFAFFDNKTTFVIKDINGAVYTNLYEYVVDSFIWAIRKLNPYKFKVFVGMVGWPTDGHPNATSAMAERFYKGFLPYAVSNKGTPMLPGAPIDVFLHALTDENKNMFQAYNSYTRHFGIYRSNGKPKYKIDLSGQGRDIYPTDARGIMRMPERWCLYNGDRSNITKLKEQMNLACMNADCTTLTPGASCSNLGFEKNISYAFNMYFQFQFQDEDACDFDGLAYLSVDNPSTPECVFPIEVVKPHIVLPSSGGERYHERPKSVCIFLVLLSILGTLFWN